MEIYYGIGTGYSGKTSQKYVEMNNFGYYKNIDIDIHVNRQNGRPDYQLIYIKNGQMNLLTDKGTEKIDSGSLILFRPNQAQVYTYKAIGKSNYTWFHFSGVGTEEVLSGLFYEEELLHIGDSRIISDAFESMKNFCVEYNDIAAQFVAGSFIKMLAELKKSSTGAYCAMDKIIALMRTQSVNAYSNKDYAEMCGLSEYHFIRRFKIITGTTPLQYKTKIIVEHGANLLKYTDLNIGEIANALGFEDSLYFSRVFKKTIGVSPVEYRRYSR